MKDRLQVGRAVRVGDLAIISISRFSSGVLGTYGAVGAIMPVAVVAITKQEVRAWGMDGNAESVQGWLKAVPDLEQVINELRFDAPFRPNR